MEEPDAVHDPKERLAKLAEIAGIDYEIFTRGDLLKVQLKSVTEWRESYQREELTHCYDSTHYLYAVRDFLALLIANGFEFSVSNRFEYPLVINITGLGEGWAGELPSPRLPAEIHRPYQQASDDTVPVSALDVGDIIVHPEDDGVEASVLKHTEQDGVVALYLVFPSQDGDLVVYDSDRMVRVIDNPESTNSAPPAE